MSAELDVLIYNPDWTESYVALLRARAPELNLLVCESEEDIAQSIDKADVLFVSTRFPAHFISQASRVQWIQVMGAGVEGFTKDTRMDRAIVLTRVNTGYGEKISEFVFAYLLYILQRMNVVLRNQQLKLWKPLAVSWLYGETLGVAGVGQIGRAVATKARALDMRVIGFDLVSTGDASVERMYGSDHLAEFAAEARFISVHMPLTENTEGLFDRTVFDAMRPDSILINTSRGGLVNEQDLVQALREGSIGGAILDVFAEEPLPPASPLWEMPNVVVTPHHSGSSVPEEMVDFFLDNVSRWRGGGPLRGVVDRDSGF